MANIQSAKVGLVLSPNQPFFGSLICHLRFVEDKTCETAWTDGTTLGYNPAFIAGLSHAECVGLLCHEVLHCAAGHPYRRGERDNERWNMACDLAINHMITSAGMVLPKGGLVADASQAGKSAEWIYARLPQQPQGKQGGSGTGKPAGEVRDSPKGQPSDDKGQSDKNGQSPSPSQAPQPNTEADWKEKVRSAEAMAKRKGDKAGGASRSAGLANPVVDWQDVLRKFIQQTAKSDYTFKRPNKRFIGEGFYLPSMYSEEMPPVAIAIDTSGSMDDTALARAKAEMLSIIAETQPSKVYVYYADARVARADVFEKGDEVTFRPAGGGGTDFRPVFRAIEDLDDEKPSCVIYITDTYGTFPDGFELPTMWVTDTPKASAPFGEVIQVQY